MVQRAPFDADHVHVTQTLAEVDAALKAALCSIEPVVFAEFAKEMVVSGQARHAALVGKIISSNVVSCLVCYHVCLCVDACSRACDMFVC